MFLALTWQPMSQLPQCTQVPCITPCWFLNAKLWLSARAGARSGSKSGSKLTASGSLWKRSPQPSFSAPSFISQ